MVWVCSLNKILYQNKGILEIFLSIGAHSNVRDGRKAQRSF